MRVLDLFCGAGGAATGLHRAWPDADIIGVDIKPQPRYPFTFVQADAMTYSLDGFDFIWASPPCQRYSVMSREHNHPDLYAETRCRLIATNTPYTIENVLGAPAWHGTVLCGSMFGMAVRRHRNFETSWLILNHLRCNHAKQGRPITITGNSGGTTEHSDKGVKAHWPQLMGMPWATPTEVTQAIPPAYAEFIAQQLLIERSTP